MKNFKKYNSIENHYYTKFIDIMINKHPEIESEEFVALEKLDGANIQIYITPDNVEIGSRISWIDKFSNNIEEPFDDIENVIKKYQLQIEKIQAHYGNLRQSVRLFGELYGKGIQNRRDYGDDKYIAFFDMWIESEKKEDLLSYGDFKELAEFFNLPIPKEYMRGSLDECLQIDVEDKGEGVVIKPFHKNYFSSLGSRFILKKKSENFKDIKKRPKPDKPKHPLNEKFKDYINENRVKDVFSKYGEIQEPRQLGKYIGYVLDDAKNDFIKDTEFYKNNPDIDKKEEKVIFNVGSVIANILKKYL